MQLKKSVVSGALLLVFTTATHASFLSDMVRSMATTFVELREVEKAPDCTLSADDALARSIELLSDGRQAEAEDLIKSAVKSYRNDIRILFAKGVLERSRYNKDAAQVWFALARKAKGNEALSRAAWLSSLLDRHVSPEENLKELIRLSDENPDNIYLLWLGPIQCREQSKKDDVVKIAKLGRDRYEMLLKHFRIGPIMLHQFYANILAETLEDYETAMEHRILAVSMEANGWSLFGMGNTLIGMGNYEWASAVLARTVRTNPRSAKYVNLWGDALYYLGRYGEAEEKYQRAIHLHPKSGYYWKNLAKCLEKQNRNDEMFRAYQRAVDLGYDYSLGSLGWCYEFGNGVKKDGKKAFDLYLRYQQVSPESTWLLDRMANCYRKGIGVAKDLRKVKEYQEKALELDPDNWNSLNSLAWFLTDCEDASLRDYPRAIELVKHSIAVDENKYNLDTLAVAYFRNKQYDEAVKAQERLIEFWQSKNPGKTVSKGKRNRLDKYKMALEKSKETP